MDAEQGEILEKNRPAKYLLSITSENVHRVTVEFSDTRHWEARRGAADSLGGLKNHQRFKIPRGEHVVLKPVARRRDKRNNLSRAY